MMKGTTLLLNASYEPLGLISWQRAITLWFLEKAEVISVYDDRDIRSVSFAIKMPSVVRLLRYVRCRIFQVKFSRQNIYARDHYQCQYCGQSPPHVELSLDHVLPSSRGGQACWENIVTCCLGCNHRKSNRTPEEAKLTLLHTPERPRSLTQFSIHLKLPHTPHDWSDYLL